MVAKRKHKHRWVPRGQADLKRRVGAMFGGANVTFGEGSRLWTCACGASSIGPTEPKA